jgi:hypothetical protein
MFEDWVFMVLSLLVLTCFFGQLPQRLVDRAFLSPRKEKWTVIYKRVLEPEKDLLVKSTQYRLTLRGTARDHVMIEVVTREVYESTEFGSHMEVTLLRGRVWSEVYKILKVEKAVA